MKCDIVEENLLSFYVRHVPDIRKTYLYLTILKIGTVTCVGLFQYLRFKILFQIEV